MFGEQFSLFVSDKESCVFSEMKMVRILDFCCVERLEPLQLFTMVAFVPSDRVQIVLKLAWKTKVYSAVLYCGPALDSAIFVRWK